MAKILVTGAGGFIVGSHLTEYLVEKGHKVKAFIRYNSRNFWGWLEKLKYIDNIEIYLE
jgi:dTDP-glucose 4,6-dehydratase